MDMPASMPNQKAGNCTPGQQIVEHRYPRARSRPTGGVAGAESSTPRASRLQKVGDEHVLENLGPSPARPSGAKLLPVAGLLCLRRAQRHQAPGVRTPTSEGDDLE